MHFTGTLTDTATGKWIPDEGNQIVTVDLLTGVTTVTGRLRNDTEPGVGVVLAQTGRIVTDASGTVLFAAGQHDLQDGLPDADGFCAYMASLELLRGATAAGASARCPRPTAWRYKEHCGSTVGWATLAAS